MTPLWQSTAGCNSVGLDGASFSPSLAAGAVAWPLTARAQQPAAKVIGFLNPASPTEFAYRAAAFRNGLGERGYVEDQNVKIEYRWAQREYDRLPELAIDLARRRVAAIAATGGLPFVRAAKTATSEIPIVFTFQGNPVDLGLFLA